MKAFDDLECHVSKLLLNWLLRMYDDKWPQTSGYSARGYNPLPNAA